MTNRFHWLRLTSRVCMLALLTGVLVYESSGTKVLADTTTCIECDTNYVTGLDNCSAQLTSCQASADTTRDNCVASGGNPFDCENARADRYNQCASNHDTCFFNQGSTFDNCLGFTATSSGLCSVDYGGTPSPEPPGRHRTPCDNACRDTMIDCRANGGETCGQEFNDCKLSCG